MNTIELHGVQLEVKHIPGSSDVPPFVFLHEGLGSVSMWTQRGVCWPEVVCRSTGRAGWMYSRRGYGRSDPVEDVRGAPRTRGFWHIGRHEPDYMHREAWDVLPLLLGHLGVHSPVLVGHSDGATIALLYASRHPVAACVAIAPHAFIEDVALTSIAQARDAYLQRFGSREGLRSRLARHHNNVDNAFWQWNDVWLSEGFRHFDILDHCARIAPPLLLVQGDRDEYGTLDQLHKIGQRVPASRASVLGNCGHSPHRDQAHELTSLLVAYVTETAPQTP